MVEIFFGIITQAIRRGSFTSVKDLTDAITTFIDGWNERCQPFTWTKTAEASYLVMFCCQRVHPRRQRASYSVRRLVDIASV